MNQIGPILVRNFARMGFVQKPRLSLKPKIKSSQHSQAKRRYINEISVPEGCLEKLPCKLQNSDINYVPR